MKTASHSVMSPLRVKDADALAWDRQTDVLVVGFGAAGAAAALSAHAAGTSCLLIDRFNNGGATARSGGVVYAGGGTAQQQKAGYDDTPEQMFKYLSCEVGDAVKPATLRRFCDDSRDLLSWLQSLGAGFDADHAPPKTSYPKNGVYLYYSGNEAMTGYREQATPAPRGHRTVDKGLSGKALFRVLADAVATRDIPVLGQCAATRLVVDASGQVLGMECQQIPPDSAAARQHARLIRRAEKIHLIAADWADRIRTKAAAIEAKAARRLLIRATGGVVLCTGGFIMNRQLVSTHAPAFAGNLRLGTSGCDGSGIELGQTVGGVTGQMHRASAWRFINPPTPWIEGIVVNRDGARFCNEASYGARLGAAMCEDQGGKAWLILDRAARRRAWREALFGGLWLFQSGPAILLMLLAPRANTLARLAQKIGISAAGLEQTVARYNQAAQGETTDPLGKDGPALQPLRQAPFAAIDISADNPRFPCPAITLGGLRVDEDCGGVLNEQGTVIGGLYAAGRAAVGIASNRYVSGLSLADCLWSGRRAGAAASRRSGVSRDATATTIAAEAAPTTAAQDEDAR